jgi:hypothetical protein
MEISTVLYYQLNIDIIVEKYCVNKERPLLNCNGKCYLMSQMKAKTQSSKENSDTTIITEAFIPLFFQENTIQIKNTNPDNFCCVTPNPAARMDLACGPATRMD